MAQTLWGLLAQIAGIPGLDLSEEPAPDPSAWNPSAPYPTAQPGLDYGFDLGHGPQGYYQRPDYVLEPQGPLGLYQAPQIPSAGPMEPYSPLTQYRWELPQGSVWGVPVLPAAMQVPWLRWLQDRLEGPPPPQRF